MGDPLCDHVANKRAENRERIREEYTPIVIWVDVPERVEASDIVGWVQDKLSSLPWVNVATKNVPYSYASDGALREEDADGNSGDDE